MGILDVLFPKYCVSCRKIGSYLCADCFTTIKFTDFEYCAPCNKPCFDGLTHPGCRAKTRIDGIFTGVEYKGVIKKLVYQFKYKPFVSNLSTVIADLFYESLIQKQTFMNLFSRSNLVLSPIPLHRTKERARGYNHADILATKLAKEFNIPKKPFLTRVINTKSQFQLDRKERRENIKGAFELTTIEQLNHKIIFLVDDIVTTGSTFLEAARILKENGAKQVYGLAFARD